MKQKTINIIFLLLIFGGFLIGSYVPQKQVDFSQSNINAVDYIKNKPNIVADSFVYYNKTGRAYQLIKVWQDTITPTTGNGQTVDISSAGFTVIKGVQSMAIKSTATSTSVPNVAVKSYSTTSVTLNITEGNPSTVSILGSGVLLGTSNQFVNTTGLTVFVSVTGY